MIDNSNLIPSGTVRNMVGGVCPVTIWRYLNREEYKDMAFPKPAALIAKRHYWRRGDIEAWVNSQSIAA
jgi:predicted DNA-binding transcriptional regulator AlpA